MPRQSILVYCGCLGSEADYKPLVNDIHQKLTSFTRAAEKFESQPQRQTPRFLRVIATRGDQKRGRLKADGNGDVQGWECVEQIFPDVVWGT